MSKIDELIEKLCPNGVEYKEIKEVCNCYYGKGNKIPNDGGNYPVYGCNGIVGSTSTYNNEDTPIVGHIGSAGVVVWGKGKHYVTYNGTICKTKEEIMLSKYLYYLLSSMKLQQYVKGNQPFLSVSDFNKIRVAVPPLEIQREIVYILDKFTALLAELKAELKARKKQYAYYRETLLTFGDEIPRKKLIDIASISRGKRVTKQECNDKEKYPVYQNSLAPMGYYKEYNYEKNKTYVISAGSAGEIGFCEENFWAADDCLVIYDLEEVLDKYVYYYLTFKQDYIRGSVRKASIPRLPREIIENIEIPIVSIEEQEKIVKILEKFDKLCNSLLEGIPAEIEARQKQYEYYRDKLLTFKELVIDE